MAVKTIITGGAGFIGSHLAVHLKQQGRRLLLVDNLSTGNRENVAPLLDDNCQLIEDDAANALQTPSVIRDTREIYHLAAAVGVKLVVDQPHQMIRNNVEQTAAVFQAARQADAAVLLASSSEVYGKCPVLPLREDMDLVYGPTTASRWSYGLSKALDEHLALDLYRKHKLPAVIVRLFNTIGPRQVGHYGMVVPRFVSSAVRNQPIQVYGDGQQTRAFCDVRDVVRAMPRLLATPDAHGQIFNLGSTRQLTIRQLADIVIELAHSNATVQYLPYEQVFGPNFQDPPQRLPDITRIAQAIGFQPTYSLEQTLRELIEMERQQVARSQPPQAAPKMP